MPFLFYLKLLCLRQIFSSEHRTRLGQLLLFLQVFKISPDTTFVLSSVVTMIFKSHLPIGVCFRIVYITNMSIYKCKNQIIMDLLDIGARIWTESNWYNAYIIACFAFHLITERFNELNSAANVSYNLNATKRAYPC